MGIDPGYARLGFSILHRENGQQRVSVNGFGVIETLARDGHASRLLIIQHSLQRLIQQFQPDLFSVEKLFFTKNHKTVIQVAEARGVIFATAAAAGLEIVEFTPLQVKRSIAGAGRAGKAEVQRMVMLLCGLESIPEPDDAADALAIALTALFHHNPVLNAAKRG